MKVTSTCERQFVTNCIKKHLRVDGRQLLQGRTLEIIFGKEPGCCMVLQGNTRVLVQVSCDISEPKASTPTEGIIQINMELSAMGSPDAKSQTRTSEEAVESQRAIERCIRDSKCIELESLCIVSGLKVWAIRVDIHTLNNDGNLIECASIAAISALSHFRRPEVSVVGNEVTVYSMEEKVPVALNLHHMPISICLALFHEGKTIVVDPSELEERICDGCYIIGINAHQQMCFVHRRGVLLLQEDTIQQCEDIAVKRAQEVTQIIKAALDDDAYKKLSNMPVGFTNLIQAGTILGAKRPMAEVNLDPIRNLQDNAEPEVIETIESGDSAKTSTNETQVLETEPVVTSSAMQRAKQIVQDSEMAVFEGGRSKWADEMDTSTDEDEEVMETKPDVSLVKHEGNSDSEEEAVYIDKDQLDNKSKGTSRGWYSKDSVW